MIKKFNIILVIFLFSTSLFAKNKYMQEGINLFKEKKFEQAKFKFEQEIVINPKSETSYLYLSKIFKKLDKKELQEQNLNTVILLNPKNEEAIYLLTLLNIKISNFSKAKELIVSFNSVCKKMCSSKLELQSRLDNSLKSE